MNYKSQRGQALTELVITLPLFLLLLGGTVSVFSLFGRSLSDQNALSALIFSTASHSKEEREALKGDAFDPTTVLKISYNTRLFIPSASGELWSEVHSHENPDCVTGYKLKEASHSPSSPLSLETCSKGEGYYSSLQQGLFSDTDYKWTAQAASAYGARSEFSFEERSKNAVRAFQALSQRFSGDYAEGGEANEDRTNFTRDCLFDQTANTNCRSDPFGNLYAVFEQSSLVSAEKQWFACAAEIAARNSKYGWGGVITGTIDMTDVFFSWERGEKSNKCPAYESIVQAESEIAQKAAALYSNLVKGIEITALGQLLSTSVLEAKEPQVIPY